MAQETYFYCESAILSQHELLCIVPRYLSYIYLYIYILTQYRTVHICTSVISLSMSFHIYLSINLRVSRSITISLYLQIYLQICIFRVTSDCGSWQIQNLWSVILLRTLYSATSCAGASGAAGVDIKDPAERLTSDIGEVTSQVWTINVIIILSLFSLSLFSLSLSLSLDFMISKLYWRLYSTTTSWQVVVGVFVAFVVIVLPIIFSVIISLPFFPFPCTS